MKDKHIGMNFQSQRKSRNFDTFNAWTCQFTKS